MSLNKKIPPLAHRELMSRANYTARESWRMFEIMAEFVEGTEKLGTIHPAVSIFGSAHTARSSLLFINRTNRAHCV